MTYTHITVQTPLTSDVIKWLIMYGHAQEFEEGLSDQQMGPSGFSVFGTLCGSEYWQ